MFKWEKRALAVLVGLLVFCCGVLVLDSLLFDREKQAVAWAAPGRSTQLMVEGELNPVGYNQYTSLSTAIDLTDGGTYTIPAGAHIAVIQAEGQNVRWRDAPYANGNTTDPTATVGMIIYAGDTLIYNGNLKAIELIETAASGTLNVSFYGL